MSKYIEPWYKQYVRDNPELEQITWYDEDAIQEFPEFRYLYDKLWVARNLTGVKVWNLGKESPSEFPVFVRPRVNLYGMSQGAGKKYMGQLPKNGYIAQPFKKGTQYSIDLVIMNNKIQDYFAFKSHKNIQGSFTHFESVNIPATIIKLQRHIRKIGIKHALINVETIDDFIVEIHLRPSAQFLDISGGIVYNYIEYLKTGKYKRCKREKTYSVVYRREEDATVELISYPSKGKDVRSTQFTWYSDLPLSATVNDDKSFRYMVINGTNLKAIDRFSKQIHLRFK